MLLENITFGPNVEETATHIKATYQYDSTDVQKSTVKLSDGTEQAQFKLVAKKDTYEFVTDKRVPKTGLMLVGWGGNNGTTVTAGVIANREKLTWKTKQGEMEPNYYGSLTQSSTIRVGNFQGEECFVPFNKLVPMVQPNDLVLGGWDISGLPMDEAMNRAQVLDMDLQNRLSPFMKAMGKPLPAIFDPAFVAANQKARADNILDSNLLTKREQMEQIRKDLRDFKQKHGLDKVIVLWTANTEQYSEIGKHNKNKVNHTLNFRERKPSLPYALTW